MGKQMFRDREYHTEKGNLESEKQMSHVFCHL